MSFVQIQSLEFINFFCILNFVEMKNSPQKWLKRWPHHWLHFQAGLVGILFQQFRTPILVSISYLGLSIAFHVWSLHVRWRLPTSYWWTDGLQALYVIQRFGENLDVVENRVDNMDTEHRNLEEIDRSLTQPVCLFNSISGVANRYEDMCNLLHKMHYMESFLTHCILSKQNSMQPSSAFYAARLNWP